ncbi:hypothetical protein J6590_060040 [Homalodisca vitripennis]|nr:hypothetical protein J6590_060040 [Homalodisca vitripennis]
MYRPRGCINSPRHTSGPRRLVIRNASRSQLNTPLVIAQVSGLPVYESPGGKLVGAKVIPTSTLYTRECWGAFVRVDSMDFQPQSLFSNTIANSVDCP